MYKINQNLSICSSAKMNSGLIINPGSFGGLGEETTPISDPGNYTPSPSGGWHLILFEQLLSRTTTGVFTDFFVAWTGATTFILYHPGDSSGSTFNSSSSVSRFGDMIRIRWQATETSWWNNTTIGSGSHTRNYEHDSIWSIKPILPRIVLPPSHFSSGRIDTRVFPQGRSSYYFANFGLGRPVTGSGLYWTLNPGEILEGVGLLSSDVADRPGDGGFYTFVFLDLQPGTFEGSWMKLPPNSSSSTSSQAWGHSSTEITRELLLYDFTI